MIFKIASLTHGGFVFDKCHKNRYFQILVLPSIWEKKGQNLSVESLSSFIMIGSVSKGPNSQKLKSAFCDSCLYDCKD